MKRRDAMALLGAAIGWPRAAYAQQSTRLRRVGVLIDGAAPHPLPDALQRGLQEFGHLEGRSIAFEVRYADGRADRAAEFARALVQLGVDVIVAHFTPAVRAAMSATTTIPIVMAPAGAPVEVGLVASLARPGGNVTGVSNMSAELGGRRLQMLGEIIPGLARVAVLASRTDAFTRPFMRYMEEAVPGLGIRLQVVTVDGPAEFESAFATMAQAGAQAVVIQGVFNTQRAAYLPIAGRHRLPVMTFDSEATRAGSLISLSANAAEIYRRAALLVDRILKGAKPADLPVEQPTTFELIVNLRTARTLGLTIPQTILVQADEVIE